MSYQVLGLLVAMVGMTGTVIYTGMSLASKMNEATSRLDQSTKNIIDRFDRLEQRYDQQTRDGNAWMRKHDDEIGELKTRVAQLETLLSAKGA